LNFFTFKFNLASFLFLIRQKEKQKNRS